MYLSRNMVPEQRAAWTDYTPTGPWADGTVVTRNIDGVGFIYNATLNTLTVVPNKSYATKNSNNFPIINVPDPANNLDAANKEYVDAHAGGGGGGMAIGGTITGATVGSALFAGTAGVLAQNNANYFWDNTAHILKIASELDFQGSTATVKIAGTNSLDYGVTFSGSNWTVPANTSFNFGGVSDAIGIGNDGPCELYVSGTNTIGAEVHVYQPTSIVYEWGTFGWQVTSNVLVIGTMYNGTGVSRNMQFVIGGVNQATFSSTGAQLLNAPTSTTPVTTDNSTKIATTAYVKAQGYLTGNQTITLSGDISGSGTTAISTTLATVNSNVGTFQGITVNGKGLVTAATNQNYAPLASPTFTGVPAAPTATAGTATTQIATTAFVGTAITNAAVPAPSSTTPAMDGTAAIGILLTYARGDHVHPTDTSRAPLASPTFTGTPAAPTATAGTNTTQLATTAFVATSYAPLASPTFTGVPAAPTATSGTNTTQLATTAFVGTAITNAAVPAPSSTTPAMDGTATVGILTTYARGDHIHPTDTSRAPLASPTFTGTPAAPTATAGTNTTQLATTAFVAASFAPLASPSFTGTITLTNAGATENISDTTAVTTGVGGQLNLQGLNASSAQKTYGAIKGYGTNGTAGSEAGDLEVLVMTAGTLGPWGRFVSNGRLHFNSGQEIIPGASGVLTLPAATDTLATQTFVSGTYAPLASPTFTGVPAAPTAAANTNTTQLATTAYVVGQAGTANPVMDGTVAVGTSLLYARQDHVHPTDTSRAPLASPSFTGVVNVGSPSGSASEIITSGTTTGANSLQLISNYTSDTSQGAQIQFVNNNAGSTVRNKSVRVDNLGDFQILNSAYSGSLLSISDAGAGNFPTSITSPLWSGALKTSGNVQLAATNPTISFNDATGGTDQKIWDIFDQTSSTTLNFRAVNDAYSASTTWMIVTRGSGYTISNINFPNGTVTGTTPTAGDNTTKMATTAFVATSFAPLASPTFTGTPAAPTATAGTNTTQLATTAFVNSEAVRYDAAQSLSSAQQVQGRTNVYAAPFDALSYNGMQINGSCDISQERGTSAIATSGSYVIDGWQLYTVGVQVISAAQVADAPSGLINSIKVTVSTANASPASGDALLLYQRIEGYRVARLAFGAAAAQSVSIVFWTKIHRTGTYSGSIRNSGGNRSYPFSFTQNVADTWEFKTVTISGDVTGTWVKDNTGGLDLIITVMSGSSGLGTANTWAASNLFGVTGTINGAAATTDVFQITGLIVLPGIELPSSTRAPFIMRPFDQELMLCQRYYEKTYPYADPPGNVYSNYAGGCPLVNFVQATGNFHTLPFWHFKVRKRTSPTTQVYSPYTGASTKIRDQNGAVDVAATTSAAASDFGVNYAVSNVSVAATNFIWGHAMADARF